MKRSSLVFVCVSVLILFGMCGLAVQAQATRTWVSGVGDDANPCSRTAPCKTLSGAMGKTADKGEINALDPAGYGTVTITKSITIDLSNTLGSVLGAGVNGIVINDTNSLTGPGSIVVTLRGIDLTGWGGNSIGGTGILISSAKAVHVENLRIRNFATGIADTRTIGGSLYVNHTVISNNSTAGVTMSSTSNPILKAFFDDVLLKDSRMGLIIANGNIATINNSGITGNSIHGLVAFGNGSALAVRGCTITGNLNGITISNGNPIIRISNDLITQNTTSLNIYAGATGQILSFGDNKISGNGVDNGPTGTVMQQ